MRKNEVLKNEDQADHIDAGKQWLSQSVHKLDVMKLRKVVISGIQYLIIYHTLNKFIKFNYRPHYRPQLSTSFLGTSEHVMKNIWLNDDYSVLKRQDTSTIHETMERVLVSTSIGRLPGKILSGFSSFADKWKKWTLAFSLVALYGMIASPDIECWRML